MNNPYLEIYESFFPNWRNGVCIEDFPDYSEMFKKYTKIYSYPIPNEEAVLKIKKYQPIVEIGGGLGYWAWLLRQVNCKIETYDNFDFNKCIQKSKCPNIKLWTEVQNGGPSVLCKYDSSYSLMLCWPPMESESNWTSANMAVECLEYFQGNILLYVGEIERNDGMPVRTAGQTFLSDIESEWQLIEKINIPKWPEYNDNLYIYHRNIKSSKGNG